MALAPFCTTPFCTSFVIYQLEGRFKPHISRQVEVFVSLHSQLSSMDAAKLNNWYKHWWNGALQVGHWCFMYIWVIKHGGWSRCGQVLKAHPPSRSNRFKHMQHVMPSYVKCCGISHKSWRSTSFWWADCWVLYCQSIFAYWTQFMLKLPLVCHGYSLWNRGSTFGHNVNWNSWS